MCKHNLKLISGGFIRSCGYVSPIFYCLDCKKYYKQNVKDNLEKVEFFNRIEDNDNDEV